MNNIIEFFYGCFAPKNPLTKPGSVYPAVTVAYTRTKRLDNLAGDMLLGDDLMRYLIGVYQTTAQSHELGGDSTLAGAEAPQYPDYYFPFAHFNIITFLPFPVSQRLAWRI
jgi:hypothetical protein